MRNIVTIGASVLFLCIAACSTKKNLVAATGDCPPKPCTMEFRSIGVIFKNAKGDTIQVKDYSVVLKSSGDKLPSSTEGAAEGPYYLVTSDGDKSVLNVQGDTLLIKGTNPETGVTQSSEMVVSGGRCECHINKVTGEEAIVFN